MDITDFLKNFVNKTENIKDLLSLYIKRDQYTFCSLFWKKNNTVYDLIDHYDSNNDSVEKSDITFTPYKHINNIFISNNTNDMGGYKSKYEIFNIIIIPINIYTEVIGVICLGNSTSPIEEESILKIDDLIALTQIIVNKYKLIEDYKKIYSDSTYFSKDLFLANMSHEIRTPLNGIIGYNQLLMTTELSSTQKGYLSSVSQCSVQLMQIINDIIDFSKLSSGNMKTSTECVSIKEMSNSIYETMKERIYSKKHTFNIKIDPSVPNFVILDKQKLTQIIINLLSNSINYTSTGGNIELEFFNTDHILTVNVIDDGVGISEQDQCKLFNSFTQIHNSLTKTGSGLGLAICKRLVELLEGTITVKSCPGEGSVFTFTSNHLPIQEFEHILIKDSKILKNKFVLIVDENPDSRINISDMFFEWKLNPVVCASTKEAVQLISNDRYNFELGLVDCNMLEFAKLIKHTKPLFPLVALSSSEEFINISNFDAKLNKPVNKLQLFNIIHKIIMQNINDSAYIGSESDTESMESPQSINRQLSPNSSNLSSLSSLSSFDKNIKILISEDILYSQTLLFNMCQFLGYNNVFVASDGQETIEILDNAYDSNNMFSLLLLDLRMPKMDGYEVIEHITKKGYPLPKIITVTASVLEEDRERCKKLGVKYFINKPVDLNQLKNVLLKVSHTIDGCITSTTN